MALSLESFASFHAVELWKGPGPSITWFLMSLRQFSLKAMSVGIAYLWHRGRLVGDRLLMAECWVWKGAECVRAKDGQTANMHNRI